MASLSAPDMELLYGDNFEHHINLFVTAVRHCGNLTEELTKDHDDDFAFIKDNVRNMNEHTLYDWAKTTLNVLKHVVRNRALPSDITYVKLACDSRKFIRYALVAKIFCMFLSCHLLHLLPAHLNTNYGSKNMDEYVQEALAFTFRMVMYDSDLSKHSDVSFQQVHEKYIAHFEHIAKSSDAYKRFLHKDIVAFIIALETTGKYELAHLQATHGCRLNLMLNLMLSGENDAARKASVQHMIHDKYMGHVLSFWTWLQRVTFTSAEKLDTMSDKKFYELMSSKMSKSDQEKWGLMFDLERTSAEERAGFKSFRRAFTVPCISTHEEVMKYFWRETITGRGGAVSNDGPWILCSSAGEAARFKDDLVQKIRRPNDWIDSFCFQAYLCYTTSLDAVTSGPSYVAASSAGSLHVAASSAGSSRDEAAPLRVEQPAPLKRARTVAVGEAHGGPHARPLFESASAASHASVQIILSHLVRFIIDRW